MAITQDRMQALIKEARHAESTYLSLRETLLALAQNFREGVIPAREYLEKVDQTIITAPAALMLYATEYEDRHFTQHGRKNERMKTYLEARRRANGIAPKASAPAFAPSAPQQHQLSSLHYQPPTFAQSQPLPQIAEQELEDFTPYQQAAQAKPLSLTAITEALKTAPPPSGHVPLSPQATAPRSTSFSPTSDPDIERDLSEKEPDILPPLKEIF